MKTTVTEKFDAHGGSMKTTVTEKFDARGRLAERITVTEDDAEVHVSPPYWSYPTPWPAILPGDWQSPYVVTWTGNIC